MLVTLFIVLLSQPSPGQAHVIQDLRPKLPAANAATVMLTAPDSFQKSYSVPEFAKIKSAQLLARGEKRHITVTFHGPVPEDVKGAWSCEVYLQGSDASYVSAIVATRGNYALNAAPDVQAAAYDENWRMLAPVTVAFSGSQIKFSATEIIPKDARIWLVVSRYLPSTIPLRRVAGGFSVCYTSTLVDVPSDRPSPSFSVPSLPKGIIRNAK